MRPREVAQSGSAGCEPAFRERNDRPDRRIVVDGLGRGWRIESPGLDHVVLRCGLDRHSDGLQQSVVFNFAHRALRFGERKVSKLLCFRLEQIAQILSIRRSRLTWLRMY